MLFYTLVDEFISVYKTIFLKFWEKKVFILSFITLVLFSIFFFDYHMAFFFVNNKIPILTYIAGVFNLLGSRKVLYLITSIIYISLRLLDKQKTAKLVMLSAFIAFITESGVTVIKFLLTRSRPIVDLNPFSFFTLKHSMPSGHVAASIALLVMPFTQTKKLFLKLSIFSFWILVSFARIYVLKHWFSDVLVSWFIPLFVVYSLSDD